MKNHFLFAKAKLLLVSSLFLLAGGGISYALGILEPIVLNVGYNDPTSSLPGQGKHPINIPCVMQDDHEIVFQALHAPFTLYLMDDSVTAYSAIVPSSSMSVSLPLSFSGMFEIQLRPDSSNYYFYGDIEFK